MVINTHKENLGYDERDPLVVAKEDFNESQDE